MKKESTTKAACCSTRQKIFGVVALAGLFACGLMLGATINVGAAKDAGTTQEAEQQTNETGIRTCASIENFLLQRVGPFNSERIDSHSENIEIYKMLIKNGCPENVEQYQELLRRESAIIEILKNNQNMQTCLEIESLLMQQLPPEDTGNSDLRIERAKIFANLSERGCPENSQTYVDLAAKELEIARALRDDKFDTQETVEVVETYKRLEMKQTAREVLDKVQKLTDPAIDFIMQVQKIIEE